MVAVRIDLRQDGVFAMVRTFEQGLIEAERLAAAETERIIRERVFDSVVRSLAEIAGDGFPRVYQDHLVSFMRTSVPIYTTATGGVMEVEFSLENLGDYKDLQLGYHHQALIHEEPGATYGFTKNGKPRYNPHPAQIQLPYGGEPLMNPVGTPDGDQRRKEFWETAIVNQEPFETLFRRGSGFLTITDAPTFEDVAAARVFEAWIPAGVAPEWLLLENGSAQSPPYVRPVDFINTLENISYCVGRRIYHGALEALVRIAEAAGERISVDVAGGARGRVRSVETGQFVEFRSQLDISIGDYADCFGAF